jgi:hypothetical protein
MKKANIFAQSFLLFCSFLLPFKIYCGDPPDPIAAIDQDCKTIQDLADQRALPLQIFGKDSNKGKWGIFKNQKALTVYCENRCFDFANVYFHDKVPVLAVCEYINPAGDRAQNVSYYFRPDGSLEKMTSDYRCGDALIPDVEDSEAFLLKVLRAKYYGPDGKILKESPPLYFNITAQLIVEGHVQYIDFPLPDFAHIQDAPFYPLVQFSLAQLAPPRKGPRKLTAHLGFSYGNPKTIKKQLRDSINQIRKFAESNHIQISDNSDESATAYSLSCGEDTLDLESLESADDLKKACGIFFGLK